MFAVLLISSGHYSYANLLGLMLVRVTDIVIKNLMTSGKTYGMDVPFFHCQFQNFAKEKDCKGI
jgi:hypothetical protein